VEGDSIASCLICEVNYECSDYRTAEIQAMYPSRYYPNQGFI